MKDFNKLRGEFGKILRESVPPFSLTPVLKSADQQGRVDNRAIISMIVAMYNYLEGEPPTDESKIPSKKNI